MGTGSEGERPCFNDEGMTACAAGFETGAKVKVEHDGEMKALIYF